MTRGGRVMVVDEPLPAVPVDGGARRMVELLRVLVASGRRVDLAAPATTQPIALERLGVEVARRPARDHLRVAGAAYDAVILSRPAVASAEIEPVRRLAPQALVIYDTLDLHFVREYRRAKLTRSAGLLALALERKRQELGLVRAADRTFVVTGTEKATLARECPGADVHVVSNIHDVVERPPPFEGRAGALFVGAFGHEPNIDGVRWLVDEVWPLVRSAVPDLMLTIVGPNPPDGLRREGVEVTGEVVSVAPYLDAARVSVAPLRFGAGVKGKVLESLGRGVPVVGTPVALEGIPTDGLGDPVDGASAIAAAVVALHGNRREWERRSAAGRRVVAAGFSHTAARSALARALSAPELARA